jgi:Protein of unknown function (DUF4238)
MTEQKPRQHTLPRFYLKGFADSAKPAALWEYRQELPYKPLGKWADRNPRRISLKSASVVPDQYSYRKPDGTLDSATFEDALQRREHCVDNVIRDIRDHQRFSRELKPVLASYVSMMMKRVAGERRHALCHLPEILASNRSAIEADASISPHEKATRLAALAAMEADPQELFLNAMMVPSNQLDPFLASWTWHLLQSSEEAVFVTGDQPVFIFNEKGRPGELSFPLSSHSALLVSSGRFDEGWLRVGADTVDRINRRTARSSERLYASIDRLQIDRADDARLPGKLGIFYQYFGRSEVSAAARTLGGV